MRTVKYFREEEEDRKESGGHTRRGITTIDADTSGETYSVITSE